MSRRDEKERHKAAQRDKQRQRQAKAAIQPNPQKEPRAVEDVANFEEQTVRWSFELFDYGTDWRQVKNDDHDGFCAVGEHLKAYSAKTWKEIRADFERDHEIPTKQLCPTAQQRLEDLRLDDIDGLWRFRFSGARRLWGIRDKRLFKVLWWDPHHQVYPVELKNT